MKKKRGCVIAAALLAAALLGGCAGADGTAAGGSVKLLLCTSDGSDSFRSLLARAAQETAEKEGVQMDVADAQGSIEVQVEQIKAAAGQGYDAVLCYPVDVSTAVELEASAGRLPIVFMNSCPDDKHLEKDRYIFVGSSESDAGRFQAEYVLDKFRGKSEINVVLIKGEKNHSGTRGRTEAVKAALADSGKKINYVFEDYADWDTELAADMFRVFLKTGSPYDCVISNNDSMALGVIKVCEEKGIEAGSFPILGVDATEEGCREIEDGDMAFTVYQSAKGQGEAAVKAGIALGQGRSAADTGLRVSEDGKYVWVPFEKVDSSNVSDY